MQGLYGLPSVRRGVLAGWGWDFAGCSGREGRESLGSRSDSGRESTKLSEFAVQRDGRRWRGIVIVAVALLAFAAAPALGATVTQLPTITGDASTGSVLTASTGAWTPASATVGYDWLRCGNAGADPCTAIAGSCDRSYTVRDPDLGHTLRVRLTVAEPDQPPVFGISNPPTAVVIAKPYSIPAGDSGQTCVVVTPTGPGQGTFTSGGQTGPGTTPAPNTPLKFITPFPVVRISGRFTRSRTQLTRVIINARGGARIGVDCTGGGCPYRRRAIAVRLIRVRALQRSYRPGATIEIRVTQPRMIGKYTRIKTRRGKAPLRLDRCLTPGSTRPVRCPTG